MNSSREYSRESTPSNSSTKSASGCNTVVCIMSNKWKDEQHPSFINYIGSFLDANSYRLTLSLIAPDFIFNCGGASVAFVFVSNWDPKSTSSVYNRIKNLKEQFANLYVVVTLPTRDQNDSFTRSYFKNGMVFGRPTFIPVQDLEMGFEKIVKLALARGVCKRQAVVAKLKAERERSVQTMEVYVKVLTSIPGIDSHDANALYQAIGSIEAIAKTSKEYIMETTDLSAEKADIVTRFFRDPSYYLGPKIR